jgi:hypothetical protein
MSDVNTDKLRDQADRGAEAARVYGSPLVKEFFDKAKNAVRREWENSDAADGKAREHQWRLYKALEAIEECFTVTIATGRVAEKELKRAATEEKPGVITRVLQRVV